MDKLNPTFSDKTGFVLEYVSVSDITQKIIGGFNLSFANVIHNPR